MSNPELPQLLGTLKENIDTRLTLLTPLHKLKGKLDLLVGQVSSSSLQDTSENEEPLLVYNDKDSSDSDEDDIQLDNNSDSENEWEEESSDEPMEENNIETDESELSS
ncbi:hypothetical protein NQ317_010116 [Molorchus minor]|uniref:Uncharacterized protein n=1 Tax=Molorchus minor TaxID=1323400 RepID=A0ABQ9J2T1_9CUCU|nr:hypothetical protein NQ317_010116 [Molorchus minor]